jgi:hypothetical protein
MSKPGVLSLSPAERAAQTRALRSFNKTVKQLNWSRFANTTPAYSKAKKQEKANENS